MKKLNITKNLSKHVFFSAVHLLLLISCSTVDFENTSRDISSSEVKKDCKLEKVLQLLKVTPHSYLNNCSKEIYSPQFATPKIFPEQKIRKTILSLVAPGNTSEKLRYIGAAFYHHTVKNYELKNYQQLADLALEQEKDLIKTSQFQEVKNNEGLFHSWIKFIDGFKTPNVHSLIELEKILIHYKKVGISSKKDEELLFSTLVLSQRIFSNQKNIPFVSQSLLEILDYFMISFKVKDKLSYITHHAIWALRNYYAGSQNTENSVLQKYVKDQLEKRLEISKKDSEVYLWTLKSLLLQQDCYQLKSSTRICKKEIDQKIYKKILTEKYFYKNENIEVLTSLDKKVIDSLISEIMMVKRSFHELTGIDTPLENDQNEKLRIIIFSSPQDYRKYQPFLHDLPTSNGGIYIEKNATFYTYQRKPSESRYSLEELTKHEYVHYLTGRYLNHGNWGNTKFYKESKMPWFEEGIAELLTGSHLDGLRFRSKLSRMIKTDEEKLDITKIINSQYSSGFKFYRYSCALISFLNIEKSDSGLTYLNEIIQSFVQNDFVYYEKILSKIQSDSSLESRFSKYIKKLSDSRELFITNKRNMGYKGFVPVIEDKVEFFEKPFVKILPISISDIENNEITHCQVVESSGVKIRKSGLCYQENSSMDWKVDISVNGLTKEEEIFFKIRVKDIDGWSDPATYHFKRANSRNKAGKLVQLPLAPKVEDEVRRVKFVHVEHFKLNDLIKNNSPITKCEVLSSQGLKVRQDQKCIRLENGQWFIDIEVRFDIDPKSKKYFIYKVENKFGSAQAKVQYLPKTH